MVRRSYDQPEIPLSTALDMWYQWHDTDGHIHQDRVRYLSVPRFLQFLQRLCSSCGRANAKLPGLLEQVRLDEPVDRWWLIHELLGYGATLDAVALHNGGEPVQLHTKPKKPRVKQGKCEVAA